LIFPPLDSCGQNNEQFECLLRPQLFIPHMCDEMGNI
jgi:hypothetical protein